MTISFRAGPHKGLPVMRTQPVSDIEQATEGLPPTVEELADHILKGHVPQEIGEQWKLLRPDLLALLQSVD